MKELLPEKGTKERVEMFEKDQEQYGTEVAIHNIIWQIAADILRTIGVRHIDTTDN